MVAYALAGRVDVDLVNEPIGQDSAGRDVFLREIWPSPDEVQAVVQQSVRREMFAKQYSEVFAGDARWNSVRVPAGDRYAWDDSSTYIKPAPYFDQLADPAKFVRVHRSFILNLDRLSRVEVDVRESRTAILTSGERVPVSRAGYKRLSAILNDD